MVSRNEKTDRGEDSGVGAGGDGCMGDGKEAGDDDYEGGDGEDPGKGGGDAIFASAAVGWAMVATAMTMMIG
jgi:hypothetical protein